MPLAVVMDTQTIKAVHDLPVNCQKHCVASTNVIYYQQTLVATFWLDSDISILKLFVLSFSILFGKVHPEAFQPFFFLP